jgi:hypothetical protein
MYVAMLATIGGRRRHHLYRIVVVAKRLQFNRTRQGGKKVVFQTCRRPQQRRSRHLQLAADERVLVVAVVTRAHIFCNTVAVTATILSFTAIFHRLLSDDNNRPTKKNNHVFVFNVRSVIVACRLLIGFLQTAEFRLWWQLIMIMTPTVAIVL